MKVESGMSDFTARERAEIDALTRDLKRGLDQSLQSQGLGTLDEANANARVSQLTTALAAAEAALAQERAGMSVPTCVITGYVAGHYMACGDCDPCSAAHRVSEPVQRLIREIHDLCDKYSDTATALAAERARAERMAVALRFYAEPEIYKPHPWDVARPSSAADDGGKRARAALGTGEAE
jgi:hypothetical protein